MSPQAGTIDLGELPHGDHLTADPPWPVRRRLRRWHRRVTWQVAGAAAVVAATMVTAGGAAAPAAPALDLQFTIRGSSFETDDENVYVLEGADQPDQATISAYRLADGSLRWRRDAPLAGDSLWISDWPGTLVAMSYEQDIGDVWPRERTARLDPATGHAVWTMDGTPVGTAAGVTLMSEPLVTEPAPDGDFRPANRVTAVDTGTGTPRWSRDLPEGWRYQLHTGTPAYLIAMPPDGRRLTSYDLATGEPAAELALPAASEPELLTIGSLILLMPDGVNSPGWQAYDVDTLRHLWTLDLDSGGVGSWPSACGTLICFSGTTPGAIDPATGDLMWTADWLPPGWFDVVHSESPRLEGYLLLVRSEDNNYSQRQWLVDASTGEPVLDLDGWMLPAFSYPLDMGTSFPTPIRTVADGTTELLWVGGLRADMSGIDPVAAIEFPRPVAQPHRQCGARQGQVMCVSEVLVTNVGMTGWDLTAWRIRD